ncbi:MAG: hypothetical protein AW07_02686 [Candidatus Accumulibacter sp. SK-11]|nr:MAG: hypothetical protein AW07_02686 [Candidatus Accumulibacter sp. SK-11]
MIAGGTTVMRPARSGGGCTVIAGGWTVIGGGVTVSAGGSTVTAGGSMLRGGGWMRIIKGLAKDIEIKQFQCHSWKYLVRSRPCQS